MASAERYGLYSIKLNNTLNLTCVDRWAISPNAQVSTITPGGLIDPAHHGIASATPSISFTSREFAALFASVSISAGYACTAASTFAMQERESGATFIAAATNTHETVTSALGFVRPTSITASQDDPDGATCECEFTSLWDGTTQPLVWNTGQVISTLSAPAFTTRFFLGPVYHAGAALKGITQISVDPGIQYQAKAFGGDPFPKLGAITQRSPSITITAADMSAASALTTVFGSAISTGIVCYLQKGVASGTRVAAATAEHVKITAAAGNWNLSDASISQNEDGSVTFAAQPTTAITLVTNSAIP